jgi:diguanylate cyclase (GGDEF)-like protein/PAS domain S-box-containing protein
MAVAALVGAAGAAFLLRTAGPISFVGLYAMIAVTATVMVRTLWRRRPAASWAWACLVAAITLVGVGVISNELLARRMAVDPTWFLVPGLTWVASYAFIIVGEAGIVTRHWGRRPDRAIIVDAIVVSIAIMVPTVALAASVFSNTPGPTLIRFITASYIVLDGIVSVMLAQLVLNGDRRNASMWFVVAAVGVPVLGDFGAIVLRASVDVRYLAVSWIVAYVLLQWTMAQESLPRLTQAAPLRRARLDGARSIVLSIALFAVPMTVVLGAQHVGTVATWGLLLAAAVVAVLVLLRLTWLFQDSDRAHAAVRARERHFRALVQNIGDVIVVAGIDGTVRYRSPSARRLFGEAGQSTVEGDVAAVLHADDRDAVEALLVESSRQPGELVTGQVLARDDAGSALWLDVTVQNLIGDPDVESLVIACHDVTERRLLEDQLRKEARYDALTNLPNRVLAFERLDRLIARAAHSGMHVGVMFADLDNFKAVNDSLGHGAGDELLCRVAERLEASVRPQDTVARLGGDEFVVLTEMSDLGGFESLARRVVDALSEPVQLADRDVLVTVSVGLAVGLPGEAGEEVLRKADIALYQAKHAGRNAYALYQEGGQDDAGIDLAADLRRALASGDELRVHFQSLVDLPSGKIHGVEALVRWEHPERGLLLPGAFVPMAEQNGLIVPLGRWVLEEACRQVAASGVADLQLAVNLSARQLDDDQLPEIVAEALRNSGLAARRLTLELTETTLMRDGAATTRLHQLKQLGLRLALDDFGTGYSSLAYLRSFPIDTLKLDRQFVSAISTDAQAAALAVGIIDLARALGLETVAEGVEEPAQARLLAASGCNLAQGFYFSRPAPLPEVLGGRKPEAGQFTAGPITSRLVTEGASQVVG